MLQSKYLTEHDLSDFGFKSLGKNVKISESARIYGPGNISIGNNVRIDDFTILAAVNGWIEIGNFVFIARSCHLGGAKGIIMDDFSSMAANTVIYSASDDYLGQYLTAQAVPQKYTKAVGGTIIIGRHVIIGSTCTIIGKTTIGEGCSIGSLSLVIKDLNSWGVYVGIPVKKIKDRKKNLLELEKKLVAKKNNNT